MPLQGAYGQVNMYFPALLIDVIVVDLRPANVLWRQTQHGDVPSVELRMIDFEDAVPFGRDIPAELVQAIVDIMLPISNRQRAV